MTLVPNDRHGERNSPSVSSGHPDPRQTLVLPVDIRTSIVGLFASVKRDRADSADSFIELMPRLDERSGAAVASALWVAMTCYDDHETIEACLNSLSELTIVNVVPVDVVQHVLDSRVWAREPWAKHHISTLREYVNLQ